MGANSKRRFSHSFSPISTKLYDKYVSHVGNMPKISKFMAFLKCFLLIQDYMRLGIPKR